jgi:hypothetical protein
MHNWPTNTFFSGIIIYKNISLEIICWHTGIIEEDVTRLMSVLVTNVSEKQFFHRRAHRHQILGIEMSFSRLLIPVMFPLYDCSPLFPLMFIRHEKNFNLSDVLSLLL